MRIQTALATLDLHVIPVLVNGAQTPRAENLPASMRPILHLNAAPLPAAAPEAPARPASHLSERVLIGHWKGYWDMSCAQLTSSDYAVARLIQVSLDYQGRATSETIMRGDHEEGSWSLNGEQVRLTFPNRTWIGEGDAFCSSRLRGNSLTEAAVASCPW